MITVIKRDNTHVEYDLSKIENAINLLQMIISILMIFYTDQ